MSNTNMLHTDEMSLLRTDICVREFLGCSVGLRESVPRTSKVLLDLSAPSSTEGVDSTSFNAILRRSKAYRLEL